VPDGVCVVWIGLLENPLQVVRRWPHRTFVAAHGGCSAPHARAARILVTTVITADRGHSLLKALLAPLVTAFDALLGTVSGDVGHRLLIAAQCYLPTSLCRPKHDHLVAGGALGGDAAQLLEHALEEVTIFILSRALCAVFGQCARAILMSLVVNLRLITLTPPPP
jgi:hypothetical protein